MRRGLSLYLDIVRFLLAAGVLFAHATYRGYTSPGFMWYAYRYGQTCVIGFFVLSGFVIAYVVAEREQAAWPYVSARLARLYSVIAPALLLTFVLDFWGQAMAPNFYQVGPVIPAEDQPLRYFLTFLLIQNLGIFGWPAGNYEASLTPGTNGPFWSMTYEATYYALFGCLLFLRGKWRVCSCAGLAVLAGPPIMALFPLWLLGVAAYRWRDRLRWSGPLAMPLTLVVFLGSVILLFVVGWQRHWGTQEWPITLRPTHLDYAEGALFTVNLLMAHRLSGMLEAVLGWCAGLVRWLGGLTFALYLCHRPLLHFCAIPSIGAPIGTPEMVRLFAAVLGAVIVMAWLTERLRSWLRRRLDRLIAPTT